MLKSNNRINEKENILKPKEPNIERRTTTFTVVKEQTDCCLKTGFKLKKEKEKKERRMAEVPPTQSIKGQDS